MINENYQASSEKICVKIIVLQILVLGLKIWKLK